MSIYIVTFENNRAISATKSNSGFVDPIDFSLVNDKDEIKSMTIFANNKESGIKRANEIADQIISLLHYSF